MTLRREVAFTLVAVAALATLAAKAQAPNQPSPRTFPQFVGTWLLDEAASTGRLRLTPRIPRTLTIATTPEEITVTQRLRVAEFDSVSEWPLLVEVYRFDGTETTHSNGRYGPFEYRTIFTLVADALALTTKERPRGGDGGFNVVTDVLSVDGDVLTLHRQLVAVRSPGYIATMSEPTNNFRHTFIYRRQW